MDLHSDLSIAQSVPTRDIREIAALCGLHEEELDLYGYNKAKISLSVLDRLQQRPDGKLVLVTATSPTPAGEGKSTITIGLAQGLNRIGQKAIVALREPSMGPVMGMKGGAAGGGYSQIIPMEDLNLHFTGDMHAITCAHNAVSCFIDNHMYQGNELKIRRVTWRRVLDMNDRALRKTMINLSERGGQEAREDGFDITVASEVMAVLCLANSPADLRARLAAMIIGYNAAEKPVTVADLGIAGALMLILKDAIKPNLVQTLEHTPALVHGGPFANIAHGCNSVLATKMALKLGDFAVTEAGFGADLGAEKFFDIKCRSAGLKPSVVVIVTTIRALKMHGGVAKDQLKQENVAALKDGVCNLAKHIENIRQFGVPYVVAINQFVSDTAAETDALLNWLDTHQHPAAVAQAWEKGGAGCETLAKAVVRLADKAPADYTPVYALDLPIAEKIRRIAQKIYGAKDIAFSEEAQQQLDEYTRLGFAHLPVCMAKTQYSLSDDPTRLGRPTDFILQVQSLRISRGAGFIVVLTGKILTMPGLPKHPAMLDMDLDDAGKAVGLF